jgi:uncharacterized protein (TIGR00251 family)
MIKLFGKKKEKTGNQLFPYLRILMLLYVKVKPNQRFDRVEKTGDSWQVRLKAPAVDGKANERLVEFFSEILDLPKSKVILKRGATARMKCLEILAEENYVSEKLHLKIEN